MTTLLGLSGSLRRQSTNSTLLRAAALAAPVGTRVLFYEGMGQLPLFNPDIEGEDFEHPAPAAVGDFRAQLRQADGVLIASPEYAHGVTGVIKNALDWIVGSGEFIDKPVAVFNASPRASIALAALKETLSLMGAIINAQASITLPVLGSDLDAQGLAAHAEMGPRLRQALSDLIAGMDRGEI
ncbi:NADPH-dependent FMN reductase [Endothiovibrio diazotrophicus]